MVVCWFLLLRNSRDEIYLPVQRDEKNNNKTSVFSSLILHRHAVSFISLLKIILTTMCVFYKKKYKNHNIHIYLYAVILCSGNDIITIYSSYTYVYIIYIMYHIVNLIIDQCVLYMCLSNYKKKLPLSVLTDLICFY